MANGRVKRRRQQTTARLGFSTPTVTPAGRPGPLGNGGVSRRCCCDSSRGVVDGAAVPLATHPPTRPHHSPPQFPLLLFSLFSAFFSFWPLPTQWFPVGGGCGPSTTKSLVEARFVSLLILHLRPHRLRRRSSIRCSPSAPIIDLDSLFYFTSSVTADEWRWLVSLHR